MAYKAGSDQYGQDRKWNYKAFQTVYFRIRLIFVDDPDIMSDSHQKIAAIGLWQT